MEKPRLRRTLLAVPGLTYRAKALALATLAAGVPFALTVGMTLHPPLFGATPFMATAAAAMVSLLLLLALSSLLSAVNEAASELRAAADVAGLQTGAPRSDEVARMMADTKAVTERLESVRHRLANRHPVTGVDTREPFLETIARDVSGEKRSPAVLGVLRMAQFDRLASVNKAAADRALAAFAKRLTDVLGGVRPLAQVDRDCFAVWIRDGAGPKEGGEAMKALAAHLGEPLGEGDARITPDVRVGAAIFPNDGLDGPTLLARAMGALANAGRMSAGRLTFHSEESSEAAQASFSMERALRHAISRHELALFYQPVIDLAAGRVVGAEALLRWRHSELGPIPPAQFIPVLEQSGLIDEVGRWVLDVACRDARGFESLGLPGFRVGVNLSERQFRDPGLAATVAATLSRHDLKGTRLELELTETALMEDLTHTRRTFEALGALGVGVAIDDFGAGASSLGDLKSLIFAKLKIDRAFVTDVAERHDSQAICAALIELGRRLDIAVLAEGVETREEVEALKVLGCSLFQGFFFARPLPAEKFLRKVTDPEWLSLLASPGHRPLALAEDRLAS